MKYISTVIVYFTLTIFLFGQNNSGVIVYESKVNIHKNLPPEMEAMKERFPEFRTNKHLLIFNQDEALYKVKPKTEAEKKQMTEFRGEGRRGRGGRRGNRVEDIYYTNLTDNSTVDYKDFFGKKFLIEGERSALNWKMTGKQKQVGEYLCQQAMAKDSTTQIEAWFTPMIPVASGPDNFFGLPGMILHLDIDEGTRTITALEIELKSLEEEIERPSKGKKMTQVEFEEMRDEKMAEMKKEFGDRRGPWMRRGRGE